MPDYTVRVELHGAGEGHYASLHQAMEAKGFLRWIIDGEGKKFRLPTAEYNVINTALSATAVRDIAHAVALSIKPNPDPWIFVTEAQERSWYLQPLGG